MRNGHIDATLHGEPKDYLDPPESFGRLAQPRYRMPLGGDKISIAAARIQDRLVYA